MGQRRMCIISISHVTTLDSRRGLMLIKALQVSRMEKACTWHRRVHKSSSTSNTSREYEICTYMSTQLASCRWKRSINFKCQTFKSLFHRGNWHDKCWWCHQGYVELGLETWFERTGSFQGRGGQNVYWKMLLCCIVGNVGQTIFGVWPVRESERTSLPQVQNLYPMV